MISVTAMLFGLIEPEKRLEEYNLPEPYLDRLFNQFRKLLRCEVANPDRLGFWTKIVERVLLGLSDIQILTGCILLLTAFIKIVPKYGNLSMYHLVLVTDLAWLSSNTHLLTLVILRPYFQKYFALRCLRTGAMIIFGFALTSAIVFTSHKRAYVEYVCPSQCFILDLRPETLAPKRWMITTIVLLWLGYGITFVDIFDIIRKKRYDVVRYLEYEARGSFPWNYCGGSGLWILLAVFHHVVFSNVFKVVQLIVWFAAGMCWAIIDRRDSQYEMDPDRTENSILGFGQLVPCFLLLIPIFSAVAAYWGKPHFYNSDDLEGK